MNANIKYPTLDGRIERTYAKRSTGGRKAQLYDSYIRAMRWATDCLGDTGIGAFVSNGGWIDGNTADGMRLSLVDDYAAIYVYNLRGNMRKPNWKEEGGQVFGAGSQATIAILIAVKDAKHAGPCDIYYRDIGDCLSRDEKLRIVGESQVDTVGWQIIEPNAHGDWINQRSGDFSAWPVVGEKTPTHGPAVFGNYSLGLGTNRDTWVYNYSRSTVARKVRQMIDFYNFQAEGYAKFCDDNRVTDRKGNVDRFIDTDPTKISWGGTLKMDIADGKRLQFADGSIVGGVYRPFQLQHVYFNRDLNHRVYQLPSMFPTPRHENIGFYIVGAGSDVPFSALMLDKLPNLHVTGAGSGGQFFPRWIYAKAETTDGAFDFGSAGPDEYGYCRVDNITDEILKLYRDAIGDQVTKDDVFYYAYGQLHDTVYRQKYAADLKKMLPHIPTPASRERFDQLAKAGCKLADLHVNYESVEPYPLEVQLKPGVDTDDRETWRVDKMKWRSKTDHSAIVYNTKVIIASIPEEAERYMLGSRSALGWIIDRYRVTTDRASGIVNDPNDWCDEHDDPTYIVDLIKRVTTVSVETMKIVEGLSAAGDSE